MSSLALVSAEIQRRLPQEQTPRTQYPAHFASVAELLLQQCVLDINGRTYRLCEIEFYLHTPAHPDPFTHQHAHQRRLGHWYFHRSGQSYRGGSYKGLDIAIGNEATGAAGGILLRAMQSLHDPSERVEGPSLLVDSILSSTGQPSIAALMTTFDGAIDPHPTASNPLRLRLQQLPLGPIHTSARVGLTLKKGATPERVRLIGAAYRYLIEPQKTRKGREYLVVAMYQQGRSTDEIAALTGMRRSKVQQWWTAYTRGQKEPAALDPQAASGEALCRLLGAAAVNASLR